MQTNALLGIGDFARCVGLSVSAVRFYCDRGLLAPARVDPTNGYRSFEPAQVRDGCLIRDLRLIGVPLAEAGSALNLSEEGVQAIVDAHVEQLATNLRVAQRLADGVGAAGDSSVRAARSTMVSASELVSALEQVRAFASNDPEVPHLMTVLIEMRAGSIRVVTTDTHRLAVRDLVPIASGGECSALISAAAARRWTLELPSTGDLDLDVTASELVATSGEVAISTRLVPAAFPDYEAVLQRRDAAVSVIVDRVAFSDALHVFDDESGAVLLTTSAEAVRLERRGVRVSVVGECDGGEVHVAIDPRYGIDGAASALGTELVIEIDDDPLHSVLFRSATDGTFVSLLMPVKLD